jgi:uncharacterized protein with GYD domain
MPIYVRLVNFTEKGLHEIKDTVRRSEAFKDLAMKHGVTVKEIIWTDGEFDMLTIIDAPDDSVASELALSEAKLGHKRVQTLRGYTAAEMERALEKIDHKPLSQMGLGVILRHV